MLDLSQGQHSSPSTSVEQQSQSTQTVSHQLGLSVIIHFAMTAVSADCAASRFRNDLTDDSDFLPGAKELTKTQKSWNPSTTASLISAHPQSNSPFWILRELFDELAVYLVSHISLAAA